MVQLVLCMRRNESVTPEEFRKHWREVQGPAVRLLMETLGANGATQALTLEVERNQLIRERYRTAEPFDGIVTLHFDDPSLLQRKVGTPEIIARMMRIYQEQLPFVDLPRCSAFYTEAPINLAEYNPNRRDADSGAYNVEEFDADGG